MPWNDGRAIAPGAVGPRGGPVELVRGEAGGMHADNDVVFGGMRVGHFCQSESTEAGGAVVRGDRLHGRVTSSPLRWRTLITFARRRCDHQGHEAVRSTQCDMAPVTGRPRIRPALPARR